MAGFQVDDVDLLDETNPEENLTIEEIPSTLTYKWKESQKSISGGLIQDKESLKQYLKMMLCVERCLYPIYPSSYGREFDQLMGSHRHLVEAELQRLIPECILLDNRVIDVVNIVVEFKEDVAVCSFEVISIYGSFDLSVEVST